MHKYSFEVIMKMYALKDTFWHKYFHPPPQSEEQEIIHCFKKVNKGYILMLLMLEEFIQCSVASCIT